jgi:DNA-binding MarR family transcriptional regulator
MRPLCVTFKRLMLLAGKGARAMASLVWLTPQRCDLMFCLRERPMIQRDLAFEMGVVRSVVSKMVTALEKLGIVERRGVEGDRRLRLVTLTQRAFSLMSTLLEHGPFDADGNTVQAGAEFDELQRFRSDLVRQRVGVENLSLRNHRSLLAKMHRTIRELTIKDFIGYAPTYRSQEAVEAKQRQWAASRDAWNRRHVDARVAKAHWEAGIPLDSFQRFPPRKRGRRPRARCEGSASAP